MVSVDVITTSSMLRAGMDMALVGSGGHPQQPTLRTTLTVGSSWADPECSARRKSQCDAYMLSMFLGLLGADQCYLGFWRAAVLMLATLGDLGAIVSVGVIVFIAWLFALICCGIRYQPP